MLWPRIRTVAAVMGASLVLATCSSGDSAESEGQVADTSTTLTAPEGNSRQTPEAGERLQHTVVATTYWIGEDATAENDYISNQPSAWDDNAVETFGGIDTPEGREFTPRHNTFYFALPAAEFEETGLIPGARERSPWAHEISELGKGRSLFRGRWIAVTSGETTIYAQWHGIGPNEESDYDYVFGAAEPQNTFGQNAGLDLSPDAAKALGTEGSATVTWWFVDESEVPQGPWHDYPPISNETNW